MFSMKRSTIKLLEARRGVIGHGAIYENGSKIADFSDYPEQIVCVPSFLADHDDVHRRFLTAARSQFPSETNDDMAISEYARQLMTEALDRDC
jgi:hypothetical protein